MPVYSQNLTACIKVNGQILRESGDLVTLPFGSEYAIYLKNLNSVRVQVSVSVDGQDATEGTRLIIAPNSSLELERFIKSGKLNAGNKFRFIERTAGIEKHRGVGPDDGLVRVEAWREIVTQRVPVPRVEYYPVPTPYPVYPKSPWYPSPRPIWRSPLRGAAGGMRPQAKGGQQPTHPASRGASSGRSLDLRAASVIRGQSVNSKQSFNRYLFLELYAIVDLYGAVEGYSLVVLLALAYGLVDVLFPLFDPRKQTLHDKFANTVVIMTN